MKNHTINSMSSRPRRRRCWQPAANAIAISAAAVAVIAASTVGWLGGCLKVVVVLVCGRHAVVVVIVEVVNKIFLDKTLNK